MFFNLWALDICSLVENKKLCCAGLGITWLVSLFVHGIPNGRIRTQMYTVFFFSSFFFFFFLQAKPIITWGGELYKLIYLSCTKLWTARKRFDCRDPDKTKLTEILSRNSILQTGARYIRWVEQAYLQRHNGNKWHHGTRTANMTEHSWRKMRIDLTWRFNRNRIFHTGIRCTVMFCPKQKKKMCHRSGELVV